MSSVASKNLYDLLGNDPDQDPELRTESAPVAPVDKQAARKGKRETPVEAPVAPAVDTTRGRGRGRGGRGRGRGGRGGNEEAFLDADAGRTRNRDKPIDELATRGTGYRGRGGRGRSFRDSRDDRHSKSVHSGPDDQAKQAAQGWGGNTGESEWNDEAAGDAIAREESRQGNDSIVDPPVNAEGEHPAGEEEEPEPEDKTKSYADYLAEQAEKKLQLGGNLQARQANEGASSKLPEGKAFEKEDTEYFAGTGGKARRERERKEKNRFLLEHDIQAREQPTTRGGRGGRGGRGRGEFRGRGRGEGGAGRGRGEFRGRGGRGGAEGPTPNVTNSADFPTLGS